jgi:hypothetical protein
LLTLRDDQPGADRMEQALDSESERLVQQALDPVG